MGDQANSVIIGIDGGGTRCRFGLSLAGRRFEILGPPANASTDLTGTIATLSQGIADLAAQANLTQKNLAHARAYVGVAGVLGSAQADPIKAALQIKTILVEDDRRAAVIGALGDGDGIVAGIGTGSFLARREGLDMRFLGGWGARLGDEASGAWLGRSALARVLHVVDGLHDHSELTEALFAHFGRDTATLVTFGATATPQTFAEFAPQVADAAAAGDAQGRALMQAGADYITRACQALEWSAGTPLCLIGGLAPRYAPYLPADTAAGLVEPKGRALDGALALAARFDAP